MLKFYNLYQDGMVFQQGREIIVCGEGSGAVKVSFLCGNRSESVSVSAENGEWRAVISPKGVCKGAVITAESGEEKIRISDVAVGEMWLIAGQSNMECDISYCTGTEEYEEKFGGCDVRFLEMEQEIAFSPLKNRENMKWKKQTAETAQGFSAIGSIFGYILGESLGVPIGLVKNYRGGNSIMTFISEQRLRARDEYGECVSKFEEEKKELKSAWSMVPCGFYNAMTAPIEPLRFRGVLWYQGESDSAEGRSFLYPLFLKDLKSQWREMFEDENLPVISVMLPPFSQPPFDYKIVRQIQLEADRADGFSELISAEDMGARGDDEGWCGIHPKYKTPIAERAALAALSAVYKKASGEWNAPVIKRTERCGGDIKLLFAHAGEGLKAEPKLSGLTVSCDGVDFYTPESVIGNDFILIKNCENVKKIRYCYINSADDGTLGGNLTNETKIPAFPFEADVSLL